MFLQKYTAVEQGTEKENFWINKKKEKPDQNNLAE